MLVALLVAGALLRVAFMLAIRPITYGLNDSGTYMAGASGFFPSLFSDLHHAVGYSIFLDVVSPVVRTGTWLAVLQHLIGLGAGALLFLAARRFGAPLWAAGIAGGAYLLNIEVVALEHAILSEALFLPMIAVYMYGASRVYTATSLRAVLAWAAVVGLAAAVAYTARYPGAALFVVAVPAVVAVARGGVLPRVLAGASTLAAIVLVVGAYLVAQNAAMGVGYHLFPGAGWNAYSNIAARADCASFKPPPDTRVLCQAPDQRAGKTPEFYSWDGRSPARKLEPRGFPYSDERFAAFAAAASASLPRGASGPVGVEGRLLKLLRQSGAVLGPLGWAPELNFRNLVVEQGEQRISAGLLTLPAMSFHPPLQPLMDLRPFLRLSGPLAFLALVLVLIALPRLGWGRAIFLLCGLAVVAGWIDAGTLPRYAVPVYVLSVALFSVAAAAFAPRRAPPAAEAPASGARTQRAPDRPVGVA